MNGCVFVKICLFPRAVGRIHQIEHFSNIASWTMISCVFCQNLFVFPRRSLRYIKLKILASPIT
uniref:Uncharacterized protein n=1 Tax=Lepeophtheirus salmonis TaxID=72036 RepID=A0A0K2T996_LEPSM